MNASLVALLGCVLVIGCTSPPVHMLGGTLVVEPADAVLRSVQRDVALADGVTFGGPPVPQHAWVETGPSGAVALDVAPHTGSIVVELVGRAEFGQVLLHAVPPAAADETPMLVDASTMYATQDESGAARLVIEAPQPGRWAFDVHADGVVVDFRGTLYATSLAGAPAGFTAVPPAGT